MPKHKPVATESGWKCEVCQRTWKEEPNWLELIDCLGMPVYGWGQWPEHLLTKKQMDEAGFNTGKQLPPPAGFVYREKSPGGKMLLYDRNQGVPKRELSDSQLAALAKAQEASKPTLVRCRRCGEQLYVTTAKRAASNGPGLCDACSAHLGAVERAKEWLAGEFLVLDTETTGLGYPDQIVQIAIINQAGEVLLDTLIKPTNPIPEGATRIHGITDAMVEHAPSFVDVYPRLVDILTEKTVVIYNASFDRGKLHDSCFRHQLPDIHFKSRCAMKLYARYVADWSNYHDDWQFQPLPYGDHSALGDCRGTLRLLHEMAEDKEPEYIEEGQGDAR